MQFRCRSSQRHATAAPCKSQPCTAIAARFISGHFRCVSLRGISIAVRGVDSPCISISYQFISRSSVALRCFAIPPQILAELRDSVAFVALRFRCIAPQFSLPPSTVCNLTQCISFRHIANRRHSTAVQCVAKPDIAVPLPSETVLRSSAAFLSKAVPNDAFPLLLSRRFPPR